MESENIRKALEVFNNQAISHGKKAKGAVLFNHMGDVDDFVGKYGDRIGEIGQPSTFIPHACKFNYASGASLRMLVVGNGKNESDRFQGWNFTFVLSLKDSSADWEMFDLFKPYLRAPAAMELTFLTGNWKWIANNS